MLRRTMRLVACLALALTVSVAAAAFGNFNPALLAGMKWRQIGPFRGGRELEVSGVPGDPATWYFGGVAGGLWKNTDAAATWQPVFDDRKIASIGADLSRFQDCAEGSAEWVGANLNPDQYRPALRRATETP